MKSSPSFFESIKLVMIASEIHTVDVVEEITKDKCDKPLKDNETELGSYFLGEKRIELTEEVVDNDIYHALEVFLHEVTHGYVCDFELEQIFGIDSDKSERIADALVNICAKIQKKFIIENTDLAAKIISLIRRRKKHGEEE